MNNVLQNPNALQSFMRFYDRVTVPFEQKRMAEDHGGMNDPQTIASIPEQHAALWVLLFRKMGRSPTNQEVAEEIDLRKWEPTPGLINSGASEGKWTRPIHPSRDMTMNARTKAIENLVAHYYVNLFNRMPDSEGWAYWIQEMEKKVTELEVEMRGGAQGADKERL